MAPVKKFDIFKHTYVISEIHSIKNKKLREAIMSSKKTLIIPCLIKIAENALYGGIPLTARSVKSLAPFKPVIKKLVKSKLPFKSKEKLLFTNLDLIHLLLNIFIKFLKSFKDLIEE